MIGPHTDKTLKISSREDFVGVRVLPEEQLVEISCPLGFNGEDGVRESGRLLIDVITRFHSKTDLIHSVGNKCLNDSSIEDAARFLLEDYFSYGLLKQEQKEIILARSGKINWKQTLQQVVPQCTSEEIFFPYYCVDRRIVSPVLLTEIHRDCVRLAQELMGWMIGEPLVNAGKIKLSISSQCQLLRNELIRAFNDRRQRVIRACLALYCAIGYEQRGPYVYGTKNFEDVWERLVDVVCSDGASSLNYRSYCPTAIWNLADGRNQASNFLRPDTLFCKDDAVFVLDAKYYKYGVTKNPNDLPKMESIGKQNLYGQQALLGFKNLYNAFVLPICASQDSEIVSLLGYVIPSWEKNKKILAIGVDTKSLMQEALFKRCKGIKEKIIRIMRNES